MIVKVHIPPADVETIDRAAKSDGRSRSSYIARAALLAATKQAPTPKVERSCFTCHHNRNAVCYRPVDDLDMAIDQYGLDAGCAANNGGMPTNRTIDCPGWAAREQG